ncbi:START-like domain-containing protein [Candidatus Karelsulcia muelleri]|uniref:START-like domain-containing protein n=1 Tax=Candidatus Karelsulcia muelleri TaxID=336810 RepID=UPI0035C8857A
MREKINFEFRMNSSIKILYNYISAPANMTEWFADNVIYLSNRYIFTWNGYEETCFLIKKIPYISVRYRWEQDFDKIYYFEFFLEKEKLTKNISLIITDFAKKNEIEESKMWWKNKIKILSKLLIS